MQSNVLQLRRQLLFVQLSVALFAGTLQAQSTGTIAGRIVDARGQRAIPDVVVQVLGTRLAAISAADGTWRIDSVPAGTHVVRARRLGYDTASTSVSVTAGEVHTVELRLEEVASIVAPVVVSATRERQRRTENSATIDVLDGATMRLARASHPAQVMKRVAGVYVSQLSGEGHSMAIRQPITTKPMYLYLEDGVPTRATGFFNHNALYEVNLPQSGGIEVLKGPGTALYGSDAIGGVVNALTRPAPQGTQAEATLEGGAYGWQRALLSAGASRGVHGVRADINLTRMDGWRANSPYDRESATVRWDVQVNDALHAKTVVTWSNIDQNDVFAQDAVQFARRDPINRSPIAFRHVEALRWSTALEHENRGFAWSVTPYARRNVLNLVPFWQLTFDPQVWESENTSVGLLARVRQDIEPWRSRFIAGVDFDRSPGMFVANQLMLTASGEGSARTFTSYDIGAKHYDYDVTFLQASPYVHLEASPLPKLRIDGGARYDAMSYDYVTNLAPNDEGAHRIPPSQQRSYRRVSPKIGATYDISGNLNLYGSWRTGFRAPSHSNLFQQNTAENSVELRPVTVSSWEAGVRGESGGRLAWSIAGYNMSLANDIVTFVTDQNTREATNAGRTRHRGVEGAMGIRLVQSLRLDVSAAVADQRYVTWVPQAARANVAEIRYDGNNIEQAPRTLANALVTWSPRWLRGGRLAAEWSHTGSYDPDPANVAPRYGGHELFTLHANAYVTDRVELFGRLVNVANRNYAELVGYDRFQGLQFTPGNPRSFFVGARINVER